MNIRRIGEFSLTWGESLLWDDQKNRLYFVDCSTRKLHWLESAEPPLHSMSLSSMPTGAGLVEDGRLILALADGLHLIDPDTGSSELLTQYPIQLGVRANDATVDSLGNFVTGSLKEPTQGSYWWYSSREGWRLLDDGISNANGPVTLGSDGSERLIFADTPAQKLYSYGYDANEGCVTGRDVFANTLELGGWPDGACATTSGGILSCLLGAGLVAHYDDEGLCQTIETGSELPSDIAFGGEHLDRLFVVSVSVKSAYGIPKSPLAGALIEIEASGLVGVKENRFRL